VLWEPTLLDLMKRVSMLAIIDGPNGSHVDSTRRQIQRKTTNLSIDRRPRIETADSLRTPISRLQPSSCRMKTRCLLFSAVNTVIVSDTELRARRAGEVLIQTEISCLSPGTELRCLAGLEIQLGSQNFPFIPGYATVGKVIEADPSAGYLLGKRVFSTGNRGTTSHHTAWGGHSGHVVAPTDSVMLIPDSLPSGEASLLKLAAIAYRGCRIAPPRPESTVLVVGLGPIGQFSARCYAATGARVLAVDLRPERVKIAESAGVEAFLADGNLAAAVHSKLPSGADIVVDATGFAAQLAVSASFVREKAWTDDSNEGGRLVVQGSYGTPVPLPPELCFSRELSVLWPRDSQLSDMKGVVALLNSSKLSLSGLIDKVYGVDEAPGVYTSFRTNSIPSLTAAFDWRVS